MSMWLQQVSHPGTLSGHSQGGWGEKAHNFLYFSWCPLSLVLSLDTTWKSGLVVFAPLPSGICMRVWDSPQPSLLQAEQFHLSQPRGSPLQSLKHLCGPFLHPVQYVHDLLALGSPRTAIKHFFPGSPPTLIIRWCCSKETCKAYSLSSGLFPAVLSFDCLRLPCRMFSRDGFLSNHILSDPLVALLVQVLSWLPVCTSHSDCGFRTL